MTAEDVAELLRRCGHHNISFRIKHARVEAAEANAGVHDVLEALHRHTSLVLQPNGRWRAVGPDLDGDSLTVVFVLESGIVVVTVY